MKKFTLFSVLMALLFLAPALSWGQYRTTYSENFDESTYWDGGTMTGYNAKTYINPSNPANDQFSTSAAVRETSNVHSGDYAWRVDDLANAYFRYECEETVDGFSVWMARWDNSPKPNITIRYSTDGGASYSDIESIDGDWFTGDKVYKQYIHSFGSSISPEAGQKVYIEFVTTSGERMLYDDFELTYGGGSQGPSISNITQTPNSDITSSDVVSVSADVTDADGTVAGVELHWGTTSGSLGTTIAMSNSGGDTYTTDSDIPAQSDGATVYYEVYAIDNDAEETTSAEQSYTVSDPATTTIPYAETFDADLGDIYTYSVSGDTKEWGYDSGEGNPAGSASCNGYNSGDLEEDWLILPGINLDNYSDEVMTFESWYKYGSDDVDNYLKLMYSTDYTGLGDPSSATWIELAFTQPSASETWTASGDVDLSAITGTSVWIAYKYHYNSGSYRNWKIDNISIAETSATYSVTFNVDMNDVSGFDPGTEDVYLSGDMIGWTEPGTDANYLMTDGDGDLIYSLTLDLEAGDIAYKYFRNGGWDGGEWAGGDNRTATVAGIATLDDIFGQLPVTFNCDMSLAESFDPLSDDVYISGDFLGWTEPGTNAEYQLTDGDGDMVYSVTLNTPVADIAYKYFMNAGWGGGEWNAGADRTATITGITTLNDVFGFNGPVVLDIPFSEDFESVTVDNPISLAGWTNTNTVSGATLDWIGKTYSSNYYAQASAHSSTSSGADQTWLITPGLNMDNSTDEEFSFDINVGYWTHAGFSVKISSDWDQTVAGISTATWDDVTANFTIPTVPTNGYGSFATAGTMDVSAYNGTINIAFVYDGNETEGETTTYQVDNVLVQTSIPASSTWSGATDTDWFTATNWDNGVPGATTDVTVPAGLTNYPTITAAASCNTLAMAEGATLLGFENLTLTGDATFTQNLTGGTSGGGKDDENAIYHMVSSPVVGATAISVFPSTSFVRSYDEVTENWVNLTGTDVLAAGTGYSLWMPDGDETVTYTGALNTATVSKTGLTLSGATPDPNYNGWHLLGNPFPAALDFDLGTWNLNNVNNSVNVWESVNGNYITSGGDLTDNVIPVGQAFFVRVSVADASMDIPLDACVHNSTSVYKESRTNYFALNITNDANSYSDNTFVRFGQAYANEYETEDATKMYGLAAAPQIYTMEGAHKLKINSRKSAEDIALNLEAGVDATYTFMVSEFSIDGEVILEDKQTGHTEALTMGSTYSFTASHEDPADRFVLHFNGMTDVEETALEGVQVYAANNAIYVNYNAAASAEISVYTVAGQKVMTATATQGLNSLKVNNATGNYLVRIISSQGTMTEKVFVK